MDAQPRGGFVRRWAGPESTPVRRALVGVLLGAAVLVLVVALVEAGWLPVATFVFTAMAVMVAFGAFVRAWVAVPAAFLGFVLIYWIVEIGAFLYLGAGEWEARNSEHWSGDDSAVLKLIGQLVEYLAFAIVIVPFVVLGVAIGRGGRQMFRGPEQRRPAGT